eukprot:357860_1
MNSNRSEYGTLTGGIEESSKGYSKERKISIGVLIAALVLFIGSIGFYFSSYGDNTSLTSSAVSRVKAHKVVSFDTDSSRTAENNDLLAARRASMFGKTDFSSYTKSEDVTLSADATNEYYSEVEYEPTSGDYVLIRGNYGGIAYDSGSGVYTDGQYLGDESLWLVGYSSTYGGYTFENMDTGKYLDGYAGAFTTYSYVDSFVCWTIAAHYCGQDADATYYRKIYGELLNVGNSYCPSVDSCDDTSITGTTSACDYCTSLFTYEVLS